MQAQIERVGMSLDEFIAESHKQRFELIDGKRIPKMPTVFGPSDLINVIYQLFFVYLMKSKRGTVFSETTFILPGNYDENWVKGSRIPDVMVYLGDRIQEYKLQYPDHKLRPLELVPDLAVEVISPTDQYTDVNNKVRAYLQDGVRLVWVIDGQNRNAVVYAAGAEPRHLEEADVLTGGDVLPEFALPLRDLFQ